MCLWNQPNLIKEIFFKIWMWIGESNLQLLYRKTSPHDAIEIEKNFFINKGKEKQVTSVFIVYCIKSIGFSFPRGDCISNYMYTTLVK